MQTIQLKNKRGKVVATFQWERHEDLHSWANYMENQNGFEFRNVDPEIPITLKGIDTPAPKLKLVAKDTSTSLGLKTEYDIEIAISSVLENLQEEFESLLCKNFVNDKILDDKKNQISVLNDVINSLLKIQELRLKLEGCLLVHGVPHWEINQWYNMSLKSVENAVAAAYYKDKFEYKDYVNITPQTFKIPLMVQLMLGGRTGFEEQKEPRKVDKPVYGLQKLTEMANSGMKFKNTISIKSIV